MTDDVVRGRGTVVGIGAVGGPYTTIGEVENSTGFGAPVSVMIKSSYADDAVRKRAGRSASGEITLDINMDLDDAGQQAVEAAKATGTVRELKFTLPSGTNKVIRQQCVV